MKSIKLTLAALTVTWLAGCSTYGAGLKAGVDSLQEGDYQAAEANISKVVKPEGKDALLYHLEIAVVKHLAGDFNGSNALLEKAYEIAEDLETKSLSQGLKVLLSNPRSGPYGGADFEKVFINYYKALNYYGLASNALTNSDRADALDGARIESRRLITRLNEINDRIGKFKSEAEKEEDEGNFKKILKIFNAFRGELIDMDQLQYRDDAMAHYMTGLSFEMNKEYDEARISYTKAAEAYENGFAKQYRLGQDIIEQAWFDVARIMRIAGGYSSQLANVSKKLSPAKRAELQKWNKNSAQVVIIEEKGLIPQREEMSLLLTVHPETQSLKLQPWFSSKKDDAEAALEWFYMLYADKGLADTLSTFMVSPEYAQSRSELVKTVNLGPTWNLLQELGLIEAISSGLRVPVSYYSYYPRIDGSSVNVNGKNIDLIKSSDLALIAGYQQIVRSGAEIVTALGRSAFKTIAAHQLNKANPIAGLLGKFAAGASEAAETRNWLLLPQEIRIQRLLLEPGQHKLQLASTMPNGVQISDYEVELKAGETNLWRVRTLPEGNGNVAQTLQMEPETAVEAMAEVIEDAE